MSMGLRSKPLLLSMGLGIAKTIVFQLGLVQQKRHTQLDVATWEINNKAKSWL